MPRIQTSKLFAIEKMRKHRKRKNFLTRVIHKKKPPNKESAGAWVAQEHPGEGEFCGSPSPRGGVRREVWIETFL